MRAGIEPGFYVFEGPDGVGKTTLSKWFATELQSRSGRDVTWFSFPGNEKGTLGELVYQLHHESAPCGIGPIHPLAMQALHIAAHIDAIETRFKKMITEGHSIVLDRFWWSTWVYGRLREVNAAALDALVGAEKSVWGKATPSKIYLISRNSPSPSGDRKRLIQLYCELALQEESQLPVVRIKNDGPINDTQKKLFASLL